MPSCPVTQAQAVPSYPASYFTISHHSFLQSSVGRLYMREAGSVPIRMYVNETEVVNIDVIRSVSSIGFQ